MRPPRSPQLKSSRTIMEGREAVEKATAEGVVAVEAVAVEAAVAVVTAVDRSS